MEAVKKKESHVSEDEMVQTYNALNKAQAIIEYNLDGTILYANENFLKPSGYTLEEIKGKHHRMFCDEEYAGSLAYRQFWDKLSRGESEVGEFRRYGKDRKETWVKVCYHPVVDEKGKPYKVIVFGADITETKRVNAEFEGKMNAISKAQAIIEFNLDGTILSSKF